MATDSEIERQSLDRRLTRIEERVGQLVLDHAQFENHIEQFRRTVQSLQNFRLRLQTRDEDANKRDDDSEKRSRKLFLRVGAAIATAQIIIQVAFHFWR